MVAIRNLDSVVLLIKTAFVWWLLTKCFSHGWKRWLCHFHQQTYCGHSRYRSINQIL